MGCWLSDLPSALGAECALWVIYQPHRWVLSKQPRLAYTAQGSSGCSEAMFGKELTQTANLVQSQESRCPPCPSSSRQMKRRGVSLNFNKISAWADHIAVFVVWWGAATRARPTLSVTTLNCRPGLNSFSPLADSWNGPSAKNRIPWHTGAGLIGEAERQARD